LNDAPTTQPSLLLRLRDAADGPAWAQFVDIYAPLIYDFARQRGLQDADAADLTQDVLAVVSQSIRRFDYDPHRGSFRGWLFTVVVNKYRNLRDQLIRREQGSGDSTAQQLLQELPAAEDTERWEREYQQRLFAWAALEVQAHVEEKSWQAFWHTSVMGDRPQDVAKRLGLSVAAVYMAKSRVLARLRELVQQIQGDA
jgi:RNA polymerase sigma factor (sigma-70 family)